MADADKNILITPNRGSTTADPKIEFTGGDNNTVTLTTLDDGTLSISGSAGQLFSISDSLTGTIFSVNDVSGIPSIEVEDDGTVTLAEFGGNVLVGTNVDSNSHKMQLVSDVSQHPLYIESAFGDKIKLKNTNTSISGNSIDFYNSDDKLTGSVRTSWSSSFKYTELYQNFDTTADQVRTLRLKPGDHPKAVYGATEYSIFNDNYHPNADKLTTTRSIALTGAVTGSANFDGSSNISISTTATADPTLTLTGDVTGSATFTNLGNATLTATVANDSHTHDGRYYTEAESDSRFVNVTGDTMTGTLTVPNLTIGSGNKIKFANNDYIRYDDANGVGRYHFDSDGGTNNASVQAATFVGALSGNASSATKWQTARTITLSGDVTGSVSWDGSANASITATVASDSHYHSQVYIPDTRGASRAPSYYPDRYASWDFQQNTNTGAGGDSWHVVNTIAKWTTYDSSHRQEQVAYTGTNVKHRTATSDSAWGGWATFWDSANDGSGSGLDADLLDGQHASAFLGVSSKAADSSLLDGIGIGSFLRSDATDYLNGVLYVRADIRNETAYRDHGVYGSYDSNKTNHIWSMGSAYRNSTSGANFGNLYGLAYKHTNNATGGTMGGSHQMVWCNNGSPRGSIGYDRVWHASGMRVGSSDVWHAGNDGSGSGLDADTVDGIQASRIVYGDGNYKSRSTSTFHNNVSGFHFYSAATNAPTAEWYNWITCRGNSWGDSGEYSFQLAHNFWNNSGFYVRRTETGTEHGWDKIWTSGNDGSGSGLDADLLDGQQPSKTGGANRIAQYNTNGYLYVENWIHLANSTGLFYDNGTHFKSTAAGTMELSDTASHNHMDIDANTNYWKYLRLKNGTSTKWDIATKENDLSGALQFRPSGGSSNVMSLTTAGRLDVRTTADGCITIHESTGGSGATFVDFVSGTNGTRYGRIYRAYSTTTYATSSDYRLKENVVPLTSALGRVQELSVKRFNFIEHPERTVDGFIAHEVAAVVPEAVVGEYNEIDEEGNPVHQGIDQSKIVPLLTAALQEAITKIEQLELRINALEN
jgi:hypothetical protein